MQRCRAWRPRLAWQNIYCGASSSATTSMIFLQDTKPRKPHATHIGSRDAFVAPVGVRGTYVLNDGNIRQVCLLLQSVCSQCLPYDLDDPMPLHCWPRQILVTLCFGSSYSRPPNFTCRQNIAQFLAIPSHIPRFQSQDCLALVCKRYAGTVQSDAVGPFHP